MRFASTKGMELLYYRKVGNDCGEEEKVFPSLPVTAHEHCTPQSLSTFSGERLDWHDHKIRKESTGVSAYPSPSPAWEQDWICHSHPIPVQMLFAAMVPEMSASKGVQMACVYTPTSQSWKRKIDNFMSICSPWFISGPGYRRTTLRIVDFSVSHEA